MHITMNIHPTDLRVTIKDSNGTIWAAIHDAGEKPHMAPLAIFLRTPREIAAFERLAADLAAVDEPAEAEAV